MRWCHREPTIEEILSDPIFVALMQADGVDARELEGVLREVASVSRAVRAADSGLGRC
jgi:hypothetical protein